MEILLISFLALKLSDLYLPLTFCDFDSGLYFHLDSSFRYFYLNFETVKWPEVWRRKEWAGEGKKEREEREKERKRKVKSKSWERLAAHCKGKPIK